MNTVGNGSNGYPINQKQEQAIREYLQEAIVPLIEQVLVKKLGQAMSFAVEQLVQPKREWQGLTDEELHKLWRESPFLGSGGQIAWFTEGARVAEAKLRAKNGGDK